MMAQKYIVENGKRTYIRNENTRVRLSSVRGNCLWISFRNRDDQEYEEKFQERSVSLRILSVSLAKALCQIFADIKLIVFDECYPIKCVNASE